MCFQKVCEKGGVEKEVKRIDLPVMDIYEYHVFYKLSLRDLARVYKVSHMTIWRRVEEVKGKKLVECLRGNFE